MPDISEFLKTIKEAIYGRDMRTALHDSIKYVNDDVDKIQNDVLMKTNTTPFNPTSDYQPATKKYVDENKGLQTAVIKNPQDWDSMIAKPDWGGVEVVRIETTGIPSPPCTVPKNVIAVIGTDKRRSSILPSTGSPFKITGHYECKLENVTADEIDGFLEVSNCQALSCDNCIYVHGSSMGSTNNCTVVGLDRGDVLTKDNTEYYDPVDDYNPATKAYVDNKGAGFVANSTFSNLVNNTIRIENPAGGFGGGANARANGGGAVGMNAVTESGFAGGADAKTVTSGGAEIDAIQLGTGTNPNAKTLQVYNYQLMDANGKIPKDRLPESTGGGDTTGILNNSVKIKNTAGGFAGGNATVMAGGAAIGNGAKVNDGIGGAVGASAQASQGGAIGQGATTSDGFAGGLNAKTVKSSSGPGGVVTEQRIDAIQLGTGTNPNAKTFQVYNYQLMDANGKIPKERLPENTGGDTSGIVNNTVKIANVINGGGFSAGTNSNSYGGGAIGREANAVNGFAGGLRASASKGVALGEDAKVYSSTPGGIDAIQFGAGTNSTAKTLQVYDYQLLDANGKIPKDRLPEITGGGGTKSVTISTSAEWDEMVAKPDWGGVEIVYLNANIESSIRIMDVPKNVIKIMGMFTDTVSVKKITHNAGAVLRGHSGATIANVYVDEPVAGFGVVIGCEHQERPGFPMGINLLVIGSMNAIPGEIVINPA